MSNEEIDNDRLWEGDIECILRCLETLEVIVKGLTVPLIASEKSIAVGIDRIDRRVVL